MRLDRIIQNRTDIGNKSYQCKRNGDDAKNRFVIHDCLILFAEHQRLMGILQNDLIGKTKCPINHRFSPKSLSTTRLQQHQKPDSVR